MRKTVATLICVFSVVFAAPEEVTNRQEDSDLQSQNPKHQNSQTNNELPGTRQQFPFVSVNFPSVNFPNMNTHPAIWNIDDFFPTLQQLLQSFFPQAPGGIATANGNPYVNANSNPNANTNDDGEAKRSLRDRRKKKKKKPAQQVKPTNEESFQDSTPDQNITTTDDLSPENVQNRPQFPNVTTFYMVMIKTSGNETIIERVIVNRIQSSNQQPSGSKAQPEDMEKIMAETIECIKTLQSKNERTPEEVSKCPVVMFSSGPPDLTNVIENQAKVQELLQAAEELDKNKPEEVEEQELTPST